MSSNSKENRVRARIKQLRGFGNDKWAKAKWLKIWDEVGKRILTLPEEQQQILLTDLTQLLRAD